MGKASRKKLKKEAKKEVIKRGRGRPKKVLENKSSKVETKVAKKVKKVYEKRKTIYDIEFEKNELVRNQKTGKHMGYCPCENETMIADFDVNGNKFCCHSCGKEYSVSKLKKERERKEEWSSKREYLSRTVFDGGMYGSFSSGHNVEVEESETDSHE